MRVLYDNAVADTMTCSAAQLNISTPRLIVGFFLSLSFNSLKRTSLTKLDSTLQVVKTRLH